MTSEICCLCCETLCILLMKSVFRRTYLWYYIIYLFIAVLDVVTVSVSGFELIGLMQIC